MATALLAQALVLAMGMVVASAQVAHEEWCAGGGAIGDDSSRCPEFVDADGKCPPGCDVDKQVVDGASNTIAVLACVLVVGLFIAGVVALRSTFDKAKVRAHHPLAPRGASQQRESK